MDVAQSQTVGLWLMVTQDQLENCNVLYKMDPITGLVTPLRQHIGIIPMLLVTPQVANKTMGQGGFQEVTNEFIQGCWYVIKKKLEIRQE